MRTACSGMLSCVQRARPVLSRVRRSQRVFSCVAAASAAVGGSRRQVVSEGGRRWKLASMVQRLFAADASDHPTSANRWASRVIPRRTPYVLKLYLQPDCHMAGVPLLFQRP